MQTKGTRAKLLARGEKGANSWLDVPERSFPPLNRAAVLTVKPINLWIHVSMLCVSTMEQGGWRDMCVWDTEISYRFS